MEVNTRGYGGRWIEEGVVVYTNDPELPEFDLTMAGQVERFAEITPDRLVLAGYVGETMRQTVTIRTKETHPFRITDMRHRHVENLKIKLDRTDKGCCTEYVLTVENVSKTPGRYVDQIQLQTDSDINPEIRLIVTVFIRPAELKGAS